MELELLQWPLANLTQQPPIWLHLLNAFYDFGAVMQLENKEHILNKYLRLMESK